MSIAWIAAIVFFTVLEMATFQLVSIWFAAGALAAFFAEYGGQSVMVQLTVFIVVSLVLLLLTRPIVKRLKGEKVSTNSDMLIGKTVIISEGVDNLKAKGAARVNGIEWAVRSEDGATIDAGCTAVVKSIEGVKLIVSAEK